MKRLESALPALLACAVLAACNPAPTPGPARDPQTVPAPASTTQAAADPAATPPVASAKKPEKPRLVIDTFDGKRYDLAEHRGRWVVVNFWATWCNPCLKEIPDLDAFDQARSDVDVIGLAYEEIERADMEAFLAEHKISYPIALVDVYKPPADFDTPRGLPMTVLIDPEGKVVQQFLGPITSVELAALIDARPAGKKPAT